VQTLTHDMNEDAYESMGIIADGHEIGDDSEVTTLK
jgi:hypothetical protein